MSSSWSDLACLSVANLACRFCRSPTKPLSRAAMSTCGKIFATPVAIVEQAKQALIYKAP